MLRRDAREAEGARLEIVYSANNGIEGSTPSLSAMYHVGHMACREPGVVHGEPQTQRGSGPTRWRCTFYRSLFTVDW